MVSPSFDLDVHNCNSQTFVTGRVLLQANAAEDQSAHPTYRFKDILMFRHHISVLYVLFLLPINIRVSQSECLYCKYWSCD